MGLMDSLKKATGIGLNPHEHYERAFEKAVLLGPPKFADAVQLFANAAKEAAEEGDATLEARSVANACLYAFITTGAPEHLRPLREALARLTDIEQIGSRSETVPAATLASEIEGRIVEAELARIGEEQHAALSAAHQRAADCFKKILTAPLMTYRFQAQDAHSESAQSRFFLHLGMASRFAALDTVLTSPDTAAEHMGRALNAFRQCNDAKWVGEAQEWLTACRVRRTCWVCHREVQGAEIHFDHYPATVTPYVGALVQKLGQDASSIDVEKGSVVVCTPCGTLIEQQADRYALQRAEELGTQFQQHIQTLEQTIERLVHRIQSLEARAHRH